MNRIAIYDMDGTIVCSMHRYRTVIRDDGKEVIDLQHWRDNQHLAYDDSLLPMADQYRADLNDPDCFVIIATARELGEPDMAFIRDKLGMPNHIISRPHGSSISGATLKINGLARIFNLKQFKNAAAIFYEDNVSYLKAVCDRFRIRGVYVPSQQGH